MPGAALGVARDSFGRRVSLSRLLDGCRQAARCDTKDRLPLV